MPIILTSKGQESPVFTSKSSKLTISNCINIALISTGLDVFTSPKLLSTLIYTVFFPSERYGPQLNSNSSLS